jgi:hypothetical protein
VADVVKVRVKVRDMVRALQREIGETPDLPPDRARVLLNDLTRLIGNCNTEIREADAAYSVHLLECLDSEEKANRAKIRAETSPEFARKREARDTKELVVEMSRSLKYYLRSLEEEMRLSR